MKEKAPDTQRLTDNPAPRYWHAVYTRSRAEKRLMELLLAKGIEAYVPVHRVMKQWSDRNKMIEEPLIRSYCFVKIDPQRYDSVLNTPGAVRYVWFSGKPARIPEKQIELLRVIENHDIPCETVTDPFRPGTMVRIHAGPMQGYSGELVSLAGKKKVIVRIEHLETSLAITISPLMIEKVSG